jgi:hypothetical protein
MLPLTMGHGRQVWESHSPEGIKVYPSRMLEHGRAYALWSSLLVLGMMI